MRKITLTCYLHLSFKTKPAGASFVALVASYPFSLFYTARDGKQGGGDCRAGRGLGREQAALAESVSWR